MSTPRISSLIEEVGEVQETAAVLKHPQPEGEQDGPGHRIEAEEDGQHDAEIPDAPPGTGRHAHGVRAGPDAAAVNAFAQAEVEAGIRLEPAFRVERHIEDLRLGPAIHQFVVKRGHGVDEALPMRHRVGVEHRRAAIRDHALERHEGPLGVQGRPLHEDMPRRLAQAGERRLQEALGQVLQRPRCKQDIGAAGVQHVGGEAQPGFPLPPRKGLARAHDRGHVADDPLQVRGDRGDSGGRCRRRRRDSHRSRRRGGPPGPAAASRTARRIRSPRSP